MASRPALPAARAALAVGHVNLPDGAYDDDEIGVKANAVYAHIFMTAGGGGAQVYH